MTKLSKAAWVIFLVMVVRKNCELNIEEKGESEKMWKLNKGGIRWFELKLDRGLCKRGLSNFSLYYSPPIRASVYIDALWTISVHHTNDGNEALEHITKRSTTKSPFAFHFSGGKLFSIITVPSSIFSLLAATLASAPFMFFRVLLRCLLSLFIPLCDLLLHFNYISSWRVLLLISFGSNKNYFKKCFQIKFILKILFFVNCKIMENYCTTKKLLLSCWY